MQSSIVYFDFGVPGRRKKDGRCSKVLAAIHSSLDYGLCIAGPIEDIHIPPKKVHTPPTTPNVNHLPDPDVIDSGTKWIHSSVNEEMKKV